MVLVGLGLDASAHRVVSDLADRAIDIRLVTFHGYVNDQEMLLARQVRAADDTRTSSAGPPSASDLSRKATEHEVAAIRQDARESLDYSVRTYYTKAGIACLQARGKLHAKAVVADEERVFVTSANLTFAAWDDNVELGLLVRDRSLAKGIVTHFQRLIDLDYLRQLPA